MVQILQRREEEPSFAKEFSRNLGSGLSQGIGHTADYYSKLGVEKYKTDQRNKLIQNIEGGQQRPESSEQQMKEKLIQALPEIQKHIGRELTPQDVESLWKNMQQQASQGQSQEGVREEDPFRKSKQYSAAGEPELARIATEESKLGHKKEAEKASRHHAISDIALKANAERAESLPQKEAALQNMMDAIENQDLSFFSRDNLAEITGIEGLRSSKGSVFKTAGKEFFLGSLKRAGARPNQWVEQQISDMLTKVGRSTEANLSVAEALKMETDIEKKQIDLTNQIADDMEKRYGYVKRDLADQVRKQLTPYANERQKDLQSKLMEIQEKYEPSNKEGYLMYDPVGNLRRVDKKEVGEAKKSGYRLYK